MTHRFMRREVVVRFLTVVLCGALFAIPHPASAQSLTADQLWRTAQTRYKAGDHSGAAVAARQAAQAGSPIATYEIGYMYEFGDGVPKSESEALRWYRLGAARGNMQSAYALGAYDEKNGDFPTALQYYKAAAAQGYPDASYGIARMYEYGLGVPLNLSEAVIWYGKASAQGDPRAAERRRNLFALYLTFDDTFASTEERDLFVDQGPRLVPAGHVFHSLAERMAYLRQHSGVNVDPQAAAQLRALDNNVILAQQAREAAELRREWNALTPQEQADIIAQRESIGHRWMNMQIFESQHPGEDHAPF
jgi:TPR repeat protein